ncbi:MAG: fatty acid desaturase [Proteobacteria bacterium]|nr:fatty acid desaturase [Pseudomonadota bacterium]
MIHATCTMREDTPKACISKLRRAAQPSCSIPVQLNAHLTFTLALAHGYVLFVLPVLLPASGWLALSLLPLCLMHSTQWGLIHEGIHKHLHPSRTVNNGMARFLSVLLGASFHIMAFGHLMHHKLNRHWQSEMVEKKGWKESASYYFTLLGGLYITEILASFGLALLPQKLCLAAVKKNPLIGNSEVWVAGRRYFYERGNIRPLRIDAACIALLYVPAFWLYGANALLLLAFLASRALMISFMDNLYHYATAMNCPGKDLYLPRHLATFLLNANYHGTHHQHPDAPWTQLPELHQRNHTAFDSSFMPHAVMQFRGPILKGAL